MRNVPGVLLRLLMGAVLLAASPPPSSAESRTLHYGRDGAGRLVRVGDGTGTFRQYRFDGAGNPLGSSLRRMWHLSVKKPAKGAWVLSVDGDGAVGGVGMDDAGNLFDVAGTLDISSGTPVGTLEILEEGGGPSLGSFTLAGSSLQSDGTGPASLVLKGSGDGGSLVAKGVRPAGAFDGFAGVFGGTKNLLQVGTAKSNPGVVALCSEGTRAGFSRIDGEGIAGFLVRDAAGKAYGLVETSAGTLPVLATLKDGAKALSLKSAKGAAAKLKLKVKK